MTDRPEPIELKAGDLERARDGLKGLGDPDRVGSGAFDDLIVQIDEIARTVETRTGKKRKQKAKMVGLTLDGTTYWLSPLRALALSRKLAVAAGAKMKEKHGGNRMKPECKRYGHVWSTKAAVEGESVWVCERCGAVAAFHPGEEKPRE